MARARNIKPGFYKNEDLAECSIWARYLFPGLWMMADRDGRLEDRPKRIKAELLPFDTQDAEPLLKELEANLFIVRYQNSDGSFIQISKFAEHQAPHYSEKASVIKPHGFRELDTDDAQTKPEVSEKVVGIKRGSKPPDILNPSSLNPDSLNPEEKAAPRKRVAGFDVKQIELPDWLDREHWELWCSARAEQKKPIGKLAAAQQIKKLAEYRAQGHSPKTVIEHSVAGSFQGLYAPNKPLNAGFDADCKEWFETQSGVEWKAKELGIAKWDQTSEQWSKFRQRVMQSEKDSRSPGISFNQLASLARQHQGVAA